MDLTAAELYAHAQHLAERAGWKYGGPIKVTFYLSLVSLEAMLVQPSLH
jgi:hypothetical protein